MSPADRCASTRPSQTERRACRPVAFGGNPFLNTSVTQVSGQFMNALSWFSENNKHRIKFTTRAAARFVRAGPHDQPVRQLQLQLAGRSRGGYSVGLHAPAVAAQAQRERVRRRAVARRFVPSEWRSTDPVRRARRRQPVHVRAGAQLRRCSGSSASRNDHVPNRLYASPRVGFSWMYGQASEIAGFAGAFRGPRAVVRGGIGMFQNTPNVAAIGSAIDNTGLPSGVQQLACVGAAAPSPDWAGYMNNNASRPVAVRRRHDRHRVLEHRTERDAVRQELLRAARAALEPQLERATRSATASRRRPT